MKSFRNWLAVIGIIMLVGLMVWWLYPKYTPTAYVGITETYELPGDKEYFEQPAWVAKIDLVKGVIVDTFPLTPNVPRVRSITVDWQRKRLFATGKTVYQVPNQDKLLAKGVDVYDLRNGELIQNINPIVGETRIDHIRFHEPSNSLYIDNPVVNESQPANKTWVLNSKTGKVVNKFDVSSSGGLLGPSGKYLYDFWPEIHLEGLEPYGPGKKVISFKQETTVFEIDGRKDLLNAGGWQPDPEGKFENKPFTLSYPFSVGKNSIEFYNRKTLEKIANLELVKQGREIKGGGKITPNRLGKKQNLFAVLVYSRPSESDQKFTPRLKVIELKEFKVINSISLGKPGEFHNLTDVYVN